MNNPSMADSSKKFFLIVQPGLEKLAEEELEIKWKEFFPEQAYTHIQAQEGGLELECPLAQGFWLNYLLKIPTRILLRMHVFKVRDLPRLFKKIQQVPWNQYMGNLPIVNVSSIQSRLFDERKITKTTLDAIEKYFTAFTPPESLQHHPPHQIFLRLQNDLCTLSIDTSGDRLHIRGYRQYILEAPLRENIAAAILLLAHRKPTTTLIDPMCGSGTFILESLMFYTPNIFRKYAFSFFPQAKNLGPPQIIAKSSNSLFKEHKASDIDPLALNAFVQNFNLLKPIPMAVPLVQQDFFQLEGPLAIDTTIIMNPPYGIRISIESATVVFFQKILDHLTEKLKPQQAIILIPQNITSKIKKNHLYHYSKPIRFKNGGIAIELCHLQKK